MKLCMDLVQLSHQPVFYFKEMLNYLNQSHRKSITSMRDLFVSNNCEQHFYKTQLDNDPKFPNILF